MTLGLWPLSSFSKPKTAILTTLHLKSGALNLSSVFFNAQSSREELTTTNSNIMAKGFHDLDVDFVAKEDFSTVQIGFKIPKDAIADFEFEPGQYLTLKVNIDGKTLRRAYSICSPTHQNTISVLVKRLDGGRVSNFLNDTVKAGDKMSVMPPNGHFKISLDQAQKGVYYLIGAGSGITPLMSMAQSILQEDTENTCHLIYGNRDEDSIIFKEKIDRLALVYPTRFTVDYVLSRPKQTKQKGLAGFLGSTSQNWEGMTGRVNKSHISTFLAQHKSENTIGYFICGPGEMIEASVEALQELGIEKSLVHREYFTSADLDPVEDAVAAGSDTSTIHKATVTLNGVVTELEMNDRTNIVQAMVNKGVEPPYSCLSGSCSTCMAHLTSGKVKMDITIGLEDEDAEKGYILTCQSHPITDAISVNFDIDQTS